MHLIAHLIGAHISIQESLVESRYSPNLWLKQGEFTLKSIIIFFKFLNFVFPSLLSKLEMTILECFFVNLRS
jgi:hypothetical protein